MSVDLQARALERWREHVQICRELAVAPSERTAFLREAEDALRREGGQAPPPPPVREDPARDYGVYYSAPPSRFPGGLCRSKKGKQRDA